MKHNKPDLQTLIFPAFAWITGLTTDPQQTQALLRQITEVFFISLYEVDSSPIIICNVGYF